jgi:DNA-binding IclR family transcriptional regulator
MESMEQDDPSKTQVDAWLESLGIGVRSEWDVLVFLHRHHASLVGAEHVARLLGYSTGDIVAALDRLETLGLIERSRVNQGVRLYQFAAPGDPRRNNALERLLGLAQTRTGRLLLVKKLRSASPLKQYHETSHSMALPRRGEGASWLKAI